MCKLIEQRILETQIESIKSLLKLGKLTYEEIANSLRVSVEFVKDIASGNVA